MAIHIKYKFNAIAYKNAGNKYIAKTSKHQLNSTALANEPALPAPPILQSSEGLDQFSEDLWAELATEFVNEISRIHGLELDFNPEPTPVPNWYQNFIRSYDDLPSNDDVEQQNEPIANATPATPNGTNIIAHMTLPELNPVVETLVDEDTTYEYWMRKAAMRYLQEFDIPADLYDLKPQ